MPLNVSERTIQTAEVFTLYHMNNFCDPSTLTVSVLDFLKCPTSGCMSVLWGVHSWKLFPVIPATNTPSGRISPYCAENVVITYRNLRSIMTQYSLNHSLILHNHWTATDGWNLSAIANDLDSRKIQNIYEMQHRLISWTLVLKRVYELP